MPTNYIFFFWTYLAWDAFSIRFSSFLICLSLPRKLLGCLSDQALFCEKFTYCSQWLWFICFEIRGQANKAEWNYLFTRYYVLCRFRGSEKLKHCPLCPLHTHTHTQIYLLVISWHVNVVNLILAFDICLCVQETKRAIKNVSDKTYLLWKPLLFYKATAKV